MKEHSNDGNDNEEKYPRIDLLEKTRAILF